MLLEVFRFSSFRFFFFFFDVSFHLCLMVSLFSAIWFLWIHSLFWPRTRRNHREPWFFISFLMFCFFQYTSMLTPHNDLALLLYLLLMIYQPVLFLLLFVAVIFRLPFNFEFCSFSSHDFMISTPPDFLKLKKWRKNWRMTKHERTKRRRISEECLLSFGGVFVGFWLTCSLCLACCLFCFFWGGGGKGGAEWVFLFQSVSLLQKHNPPKNKTEKTFLNDFWLCCFVFAGVSFTTPKEPPTQKKSSKNKRKG